MIQIPVSRISRFESSVLRELRPQLPNLDTTEDRLVRLRSIALRAGFLTHLDWGLDLPHPDVSQQLLLTAAELSDEMSWLSEKITTDDAFGCWALPLPAEHDEKNRARYPTLSAKRFEAQGELAHRFVVRRMLGQLSTEQHLDHLCRVHACCNPTHLEILSHTSNVRRGGFARKSVAGQQRLDV